MKEIDIARLENIAVPVPAGMNDIDTMRTEIKGYIDVFFGRVSMPIDIGINTLYEVAVAYYSRAKELELSIKEMENKGLIDKQSPIYKFRTGELRSFIELCKSAQNQGSRRITIALSELNFKES